MQKSNLTVEKVLDTLRKPMDINAFYATSGYCPRYSKLTSITIENQTIKSCHLAWLNDHTICNECPFRKGE